jgi:chromosome segregation ATPase
MESDCRVDECEKRMDWLSKEVLEWKATAEGYKNQYEELKTQKEADDKKCEETCAACNERYEDVLADRNRLREEVARLTDERNTAVHENTEMMFDINELQDKWEAEHNLRVEAEKAYDKVASEAYDMHQQITNLTVDNTRLENKVEELEAEVDACRHNIDGYIEGNRRMRAEYEKKLEVEQDQTKHWRKKYEELLEEHNELETDYDALVQTKQEYGEEIDRLRKVVVELQTNRFTTDEFIGMLVKNFMPSPDK